MISVGLFLCFLNYPFLAQRLRNRELRKLRRLCKLRRLRRLCGLYGLQNHEDYEIYTNYENHVDFANASLMFATDFAVSFCS